MGYFNLKHCISNNLRGVILIGPVFQSTLASVNIQVLPDKGQKLLKQIQELEDALGALALSPEQGEVGCAPGLEVRMHFTRDIHEAILIKNVDSFTFPFCCLLLCFLLNYTCNL